MDFTPTTLRQLIQAGAVARVTRMKWFDVDFLSAKAIHRLDLPELAPSWMGDCISVVEVPRTYDGSQAGGCQYSFRDKTTNVVWAGPGDYIVRQYHEMEPAYYAVIPEQFLKSIGVNSLEEPLDKLEPKAVKSSQESRKIPNHGISGTHVKTQLSDIRPIFYLSERGEPLLYDSIPPSKAILTTENYPKWYELYLVMPDGSVEVLSTDIIDAVCQKSGKQLWIDHNFHPRLFELVAEMLGCEYDEIAHEVAAGRWVMEQGVESYQYLMHASFEKSDPLPPELSAMVDGTRVRMQNSDVRLLAETSNQLRNYKK